MKIAVVWPFDKASQIWDNWRDGYRAALDVVGETNDVCWYLDGALPHDEIDWDFILVWDDSNSPTIDKIMDIPCRKGLSLTTDPTNWDNLHKLDVVFVESDPIYKAVRAQGIRTIKAFGTDTDFFCPSDEKKDIEYFYPATFSPWKRQDELAFLGNRIKMVGTVQPDGQEIYEKCLKSGCDIEVGYFPVEKIKSYYDRTQNVIIPAVHGSERTVLECMSMNIPVSVTSSINKRAQSYMEEFEFSGCDTTRQFVLENYSHKKMAEALLRGING